MKTAQISLLLFLFIFTSCSTWNAKEWENLKERKFYLKTFHYSGNRQKKENAIKIMEEFPTGKILKILTHKYDIIIDSSDFNNFISANDVSQIKASGFIFDVDFIWENKNTHVNIIDIEYKNMYDVSTAQNTQAYKISLTVEGQERASFMKSWHDNFPIFEIIASDLGYKKLNDDNYINKNNKKTLNLAADETTRQNTVTNDENKISKEKIMQQIKDYILDKPLEEKKKFREDIIKYLYTIIE